MRKRSIEKKRAHDSSKNKTGGGSPDILPVITDIDEAILRIVNYTQPLLQVNDSNLSLSETVIESGSSSSAPKRQKFNEEAKLTSP